MKNITTPEYRRNLPHIQPKGAMIFITFRLSGSIPIKTLEALKESYKTQIINNQEKNYKQLKAKKQEGYFLDFDNYLDSNPNGPYHLADNEIAKLVYDSIIYRDGKDYKLVCFCIMSNHVHMIIYKLSKPLDKTMQELKAYTGRVANKILRQRDDAENISRSTATSSKFWQAESFDRIVRNKKDMAVKINYTLNNPVKAGLINNWKEWKWSYCRPEFIG